MLTYLAFEIIASLIAIISIGALMWEFLKNSHATKVITSKRVILLLTVLGLSISVGFFAHKTYPPAFAMPPFDHSHAPGELPASIPLSGIYNFFKYQHAFEKVTTIGADPNSVPKTPQKPDSDGIIRINLIAQEVISQIAPDIYFNYWTYNRQVPGPMLRIKEGDTVEISLTNHPSSLHDHNIDLHAVTGPGGGASLTHVKPGQTKTFQFKALNPGLYVYHCAMPNVSTHNSHGQYGLILVDPKKPLAKVDREFYIMQGELYTMGQLGKKGLVPFDSKALLDGRPNYVTFNGMIERAPRMEARVGDRIRMYVGNGGVNLISSFHIIGEIFDTVYPEANIGGTIEKNVQTTAVLAGGATIVDFTVDVPGKYLLVDHALARMNKGAWAMLTVTGPKNEHIFKEIPSENQEMPNTMH
ncbi:MAG: multicopper oxidase domain-containing protein [Microgenomates group bacterium]